MSDKLQHTAYLPISAFVEGNFECCRLGNSIILHKNNLSGSRLAIIQFHPIAQLCRALFFHKTFYAHIVNFGNVVAGVREAKDKVTVIGEKKQAFAVLVQSSDGDDSLFHLSNQLHNGFLGVRV